MCGRFSGKTNGVAKGVAKAAPFWFTLVLKSVKMRKDCVLSKRERILLWEN